MRRTDPANIELQPSDCALVACHVAELVRLASPPHAPGARLANLSLCAAGHQTAAVLSTARRAAA